MKRRHDNGQGRGRKDRAANSLDCADGHHLGAGLGEARPDARQGEHHDPREVDVTATKVVGGATTEEQEAREGQDVGVDDPLRTRIGKVKVAAHTGQGDVDD